MGHQNLGYNSYSNMHVAKAVDPDAVVRASARHGFIGRS